jgi:hypothetical protein
MIRYRENMTDEEAAQLLAECEAWDKCYAECAEAEAKAQAESEESFDPVEMGWVDKRGKP